MNAIECFPGATNASGIVFWDDNANGIHDAGEQGVSGVRLTALHRVATTGSNGFYQFSSATNEPFLTIALSFPNGTFPSTRWFRRMKKPDTAHADFGLRASTQAPYFVFVHLTDSHLASSAIVARAIAECERLPIKPAFYIDTGDLGTQTPTVNNMPLLHQVFDPPRNSLATVRAPLFIVAGNHDYPDCRSSATNLPATTVQHPFFGDKLWQRYFCPPWWSFTYGDVHFMGFGWDEYVLASNAWISYPAAARAWFTIETNAMPRGARTIISRHSGASGVPSSTLKLLGNTHEEGPLNGNSSMLQGGALTDEPLDNGHTWDGRPLGYRILSVESNRIDHIYVGLGEPHSIILDAPRRDVAVTVQTAYTVSGKVFDPSNLLTSVALTVNGATSAVVRTPRRLWSEFQSTLALTSSAEGFLDVTVRAAWQDGVYQVTEPYLFLTGRQQAFAAAGDALITGHVYRAGTTYQLVVNGTPITNLAASVTRFCGVVPSNLLQRLNRVTLSNITGATTLDQVRMQYQGQPFVDQSVEMYLATQQLLDKTNTRYFDLTYPGNLVQWNIQQVK